MKPLLGARIAKNKKYTKTKNVKKCTLYVTFVKNKLILLNCLEENVVCQLFLVFLLYPYFLVMISETKKKYKDSIYTRTTYRYMYIHLYIYIFFLFFN